MTITLHNVELIHDLSTYNIADETQYTQEQLLGILNSDFSVKYTSSGAIDSFGCGVIAKVDISRVGDHS